LDSLRARNIAALYDALRRKESGEPLVSITASLSDSEKPNHLIIKRKWRTILPAWRTLSAVTKDLLRYLALERIQATAFTIDLGNDLLATHSYGEVTSRNSLRNRVAKALRAEFDEDVPFTFTMEVNRHGRLHLHGSVGITHANRSRLMACLQKAGGRWAHSGGHIHQVHLKDLYTPQVWHEYLTKGFRASNPVRPKQAIAKSHSADRLAKALYEEMLDFLQDYASDLDAARVGYVASLDAESTRLISSFFRKRFGQ